MLNRDGMTTVSATNARQILANVKLQSSVGCVVPASLGVNVDGRMIAKAGTPVYIDLTNRQTPVVAADPTNVMNAVLLHDVDVTGSGDQNGTALLFGFINTQRLDTDVQALVTTAAAAGTASRLLVFINGDA